MTRIDVRHGQDIASALRAFKKKCAKDGVLKDFKRAQRFEKPSDRKRKDEKAQNVAEWYNVYSTNTKFIRSHSTYLACTVAFFVSNENKPIALNSYESYRKGTAGERHQ